MNKEYVKTIREKIGHDMLIFCGAATIVYKDNQILLQQRKDSGYWDFHGGCVEVGEKVEDAAKRELFEETGLIAESLTFFNIFSGESSLHTYPNNDQSYIIDIIFTCNAFTGQLPSSTEETLALEWFDMNHLPDKITSKTRNILNQFIDSIMRKDDLHQLIYDYELAIANRTINHVDTILADCFIEHGSSGTIYNKNDVIEAFKHFKIDNEIQIVDFKIDIKSDTLILATFKTIKKDKDAIRSSLWQYIDGKWQMVFHQGTKTL